MRARNNMKTAMADLSIMAFEGAVTLNPPLVEAEISTFLALAGEKVKTVLEVGCAAGRVGNHLFRIYGKGYHGIDINNPAVRLFKERNPRARVKTKNVFREKHHFDAIFIPFTTLNLFNFRTQKELIYKLSKLAPKVILDTMFPDDAGGKKDRKGKKTAVDIGLPEYKYKYWYGMRRRLRAVAKNLRLAYHEDSYLFAEQDGRKDVHQMILLSSF